MGDVQWKPVGHGVPSIWDVPHLTSTSTWSRRIAHILANRFGACGPEFVDCVHREVGRKPLPPNYLNPDFQRGAVVHAMGGHLRDHIDPVYSNTQPAAHRWPSSAYQPRHLLRSHGDARLPPQQPQDVFPHQITAGGGAEWVLPIRVLRSPRREGQRVYHVEKGFCPSRGKRPEAVLAGK